MTPHNARCRARHVGENAVERLAIPPISGAGITPTTIAAIDAASTNFSTTFIPAKNGAGNYVKFTITAGTFTVTAVPAAADSTTRRAPVNGIQIVPLQ